jgi:hypothetical protein
METKRRGVLIFLLVFLVVAGAISATVLLANGGRNLDLLLTELGLKTRTLVVPKPGRMESFKGKRLGAGTVMLPDRIFAPPVEARTSAFLRSLRKNGERLCQALRKAGFDMTPWEAGAFSQTVRECSLEDTIPNLEKLQEPSTFFLIVKGSAEGDIFSARVKFIFTEESQRAPLAARAASMLQVFSEHTGWSEFGARAADVARLEPFAFDSSGIGIRFASEFSGAGRYNLIVSAASRLTPPQRRTQDYFDRKRYWPLLPEHGGPVPAAEPEG